MHKSFDIKLKSNITYIFVGECYIGGGNDIICTVLGSCIAICLYDKKRHIGGMIHYLLPEMSNNRDVNLSILHFGDSSIEYLINKLLLKGADKQMLVAKIFGGANISDTVTENESVGHKNIIAARNILKMNKINILTEDVGLEISRKIYFLPGSNKVFLKEVK